MSKASELTLSTRLSRFIRKPWREKVYSLRFRFKGLWNRVLPFVPVPTPLPFGGWWLAWNDEIGDAIFLWGYEEAEQRFVERFLKSGMTVLDIGAHQGFYTLLASQLVGPQGRVVAFEPSPRERRRLCWNLRMNRCRNVRIEPLALAAREGELRLFLVKGRETGLNSLRPPKVSEPVEVIPVQATTLDAYLGRSGIEKVDFIKMDVEGAELEVLKGAERLLQRTPRPVWIIEVQDIRTEAFGYSAKDILEFLWGRGFHWFKITQEGRLLPLASPEELIRWPGYNFVAVPKERLQEVSHLLAEGEPQGHRDEGVPVRGD